MGNARFLAHDIEEDDEDIKLELYIWALGLHWQQHYQEMLSSREALWRVIGHRGIVSRACCEKVGPKELTSLSKCS
jgi:speedy protein